MFSAPKSIRLALVNKVQLRTSLGLKKSLRERAKIKQIFVAGGGGGGRHGAYSINIGL